MSDAKSNYAEGLAVQYLLTSTVITRPTSWYLALHTALPGGNGTNAELVGNGYSRQAVSFTFDGFDKCTNDSQIEFGPATADWGTITHFSVWDSAVGGNCLYTGALGATKDIFDTDVLIWAANSLSILEK